MSIEDLFEAESRLRIAAREYSSVEHSTNTIETRRTRMRELRVAARMFSRIADTFENAVNRPEIQDDGGAP